MCKMSSDKIQESILLLGNKTWIVTQDSVTPHYESSSAEYTYIVIGAE